MRARADRRTASGDEDQDDRGTEDGERHAEHHDPGAEDRRRDDRHPPSGSADGAGSLGAAPPPHQGTGDARGDDGEAEHGGQDHVDGAEVATLVQRDAVADGLGQGAVVGVPVLRDHGSAEPVDVDRAFGGGVVERVADGREDPGLVAGDHDRHRAGEALPRADEDGGVDGGDRPLRVGGGPRHLALLLRPGDDPVTVRQRLVERGGRVGQGAVVLTPEGGAGGGGELLGLRAPDARPRQAGDDEEQQAHPDERTGVRMTGAQAGGGRAAPAEATTGSPPADEEVVTSEGHDDRPARAELEDEVTDSAGQEVGMDAHRGAADRGVGIQRAQDLPGVGVDEDVTGRLLWSGDGEAGAVVGGGRFGHRHHDIAGARLLHGCQLVVVGGHRWVGRGGDPHEVGVDHRFQLEAEQVDQAGDREDQDGRDDDERGVEVPAPEGTEQAGAAPGLRARVAGR